MARGFCICVEMAGDSLFFPLLFDLGLREFSVTPIAILKIKEVASRITEEEACKIARKALDRDSSGEIMELLEAFSFINQNNH